MADSRTFSVSAGDALLERVPEILMFGDARHRTAEPQLEPHYNPGIEICLCRSGIYRWDVEGEPVEIRPGEVSVTRPWQLHSGHNNLLGPGRLNWIVLPAAGSPGRLEAPVLEGVLGNGADALFPVLAGSSRAFVGAMPEAVVAFDRIRSELEAHEPGRHTALRAYVALLITDVARRLEEGGALAGDSLSARARASELPARVVALLRDVEREPANDWSTAGMAAEAGLGVTAFTDWCRRATGRSPRWFVLACRLDRARDELATSSRSVTDIALSLGFSSSQHFSSAFRKLFGESPTSFRDRSGRP